MAGLHPWVLTDNVGEHNILDNKKVGKDIIRQSHIKKATVESRLQLSQLLYTASNPRAWERHGSKSQLDTRSVAPVEVSKAVMLAKMTFLKDSTDAPVNLNL